MADAK